MMVDEVTALLQEKLTALEKALVLETDASVKFKLRNEIAEAKQMLAERGAETGMGGNSSGKSGGTSFGNISIGTVGGNVNINQAGNDIKIIKG